MPNNIIIKSNWSRKLNEVKSLSLVLYRSPRLLIGIILEYIASLGLLSYYLFLFGNDPLLYLQMSQGANTLLFLLMMYVSYEYILSIRKSGVEEVVLAQSKTKISLYGIAFFVLLIPVVLNFFLGFLFPACAALMQGMPYPFLFHVFLVTFLDNFLAGLVAVCFGVVCGLRFERVKGYSLIALFFFLILSASDLIPGILNDSYHIDIWPLKKLFSSIFLPDQDWTIDYQYGLPIEPFRWNCVLFWCFLFLSYIFSKVSSRSSKIRFPLVAVCLALSLVNLWGFFNSGSKIDLSEAPNSVFRADQVYYFEEYPREEPADFQITAYEMDLHIDRQLKAAVTMDVTSLESYDVYRFTLYHSYKIHRVFNENGTNLSFSQEGDYFTVTPDEEAKKITVEYEGYSPMFYSNSQGICLPGCFPYYPWAGYKQIYYATPDAESGLVSFIPRTDLPETSYSVSLSSKYPVYSNMGRFQSTEPLSGNTNALTLMEGMLEEQESSGYDMVSCWTQPEFFQFSPGYFDELQTAIRKIEEEKGYEDHIDLKKYTLFEINETMLNRCGYGLAVVFDDHIFLSAYPDVRGVAQTITYFVHEGVPLTQEEKKQSEGSMPW
jgi:hypothetical protein